jgi:hypothetical protein
VSKTVRVNLSIPAEIDAELAAAAGAQGVSKSALVMQAISYARPHWRRVARQVLRGAEPDSVDTRLAAGAESTKSAPMTRQQRR